MGKSQELRSTPYKREIDPSRKIKCLRLCPVGVQVILQSSVTKNVSNEIAISIDVVFAKSIFQLH